MVGVGVGSEGCGAGAVCADEVFLAVPHAQGGDQGHDDPGAPHPQGHHDLGELPWAGRAGDLGYHCCTCKHLRHLGFPRRQDAEPKYRLSYTVRHCIFVLCRTLLTAVPRTQMPFYSMHRAPHVWADPDAFKPERWLGSQQQRGAAGGEAAGAGGGGDTDGDGMGAVADEVVRAAGTQTVRGGGTAEQQSRGGRAGEWGRKEVALACRAELLRVQCKHMRYLGSQACELPC